MGVNKNLQGALINLCFEAEAENYNQYWLMGLVKYLNLYDVRNIEQRKKIMRFLAETNTLTQRLYLELTWLRYQNEN